MTGFNLLDDIKYAMQNPFGVNFETHTIGGKKGIYLPLGSVLNLIGYNDYLERIVGVARVALGLYALATSSDKQQKVVAAGHIFRGIMEMSQSFEKYLLILDIAATLFNIAKKYAAKGESFQPEIQLKDLN